MDDYCGCCGNEISDRLSSLWCERCRGHIGQFTSGHPWEKTYAAMHGEDCPFQVSRTVSDATNRDVPSVWDPRDPPGGRVCGACGMPVESEPCREHQPQAYIECVGEPPRSDEDLRAALLALHRPVPTWTDSTYDEDGVQVEQNALYDEAGRLVAASNYRLHCANCYRDNEEWPCPTARALGVTA
jgi:hypothetical protein